jgi:hypothetical protein
MGEENTEYTKQIIEIADYIFANPDATMNDVISYFFVRFRKTGRTIQTYIAKAKKYNLKRLKEQEDIKNEILHENTKEYAEDILSRYESLKILAKIARGAAKKLPSKTIMENGSEKTVEWEIQYPSDRERKEAIALAAKIEGWEAEKKIDIDIGQKPPAKVVIELVDFSNKNKNGTVKGFVKKDVRNI